MHKIMSFFVFGLLLDVLTNVSSASSMMPNCDYDNDKTYVETLSGSDQYKTSILVEMGINQGICPDLMNTILKKEKEDDLFLATRAIMAKYFDQVVLAIQLMKNVSNDDPNAISFFNATKRVKQFGDYLKGKCPNQSSTSDACVALNSYNNYMKQVQQKFDEALAVEQAEQKEIERRNSPEGIIEQACSCDRFIALNQQVIERQKEIAKVSGTSDLVALHNAGARIVDLTSFKNGLVAKYTMVTKKDLRKYECKGNEDSRNPFVLGTQMRGF